jgi:hypothetical protein
MVAATTAAANIGQAVGMGSAVGGAMANGATAISTINGVSTVSEATMIATNEAQDRLAQLSMAMQAAAAARSMMMQAIRDFVKDAKDGVKDQGEAGHKP